MLVEFLPHFYQNLLANMHLQNIDPILQQSRNCYRANIEATV